MIKKILGLLVALQLIAVGTAQAQTYKVQNLQVLGTAQITGATSFGVRPTYNGATLWDSNNLVIGNYATLSSPVFTGTPVVPGYLTTAAAAATYAPTASPTFTGTVTIPSGASIAGYLSTTAAASQYAPLSGPTFTGTVTASTFSGAGTSLTGTAAGLSVGGNAATATRATSLSAGTANQIPYQTSPNATAFIAAPSVTNTYLQWNGTAYTWAAGGGGSGGSGTVTSVAASGGSTGLTFTGSPVTSTGTFTLGGTLAAAAGGTGATSATAHGVLIGQGTAAMTTAAAGTAGRVLMDQGASTDPKFVKLGAVVLTGADPTGATDSTGALQTAINTIVPAGLELDIPPGNYRISAALSIPFGWGWKIQGFSQGATTITQYSNNTPIFNFATGVNGGTPEDVGPYQWAINDMMLAWNTPQSTANTKSVGIFFTNSNETYFDWQVSRIGFTNAYRGIALDSAANSNVWGMSIRDIVYGSTNSGSAINFEAAGTGQPNVSIDGVYITATNIAASEDLIGVNNVDSGWFNHIEVNGNTNGSIILNLSGQGVVGSIKCEVCTFGPGQFAYRFTNAKFSIGSISFDNVTIAASGGAAYAIDANGGGGGTTLTIGQFSANYGSVAGQFYLVNSGESPNFSVRFLSAPSGLVGVANVFLTQVPGASSANGVSIDDWQQTRLSPDVGNANSSWTTGNANTIMYNTPITAARTLTLTDSSTNSNDTNLYNGVKVCLLRTAAATGAFAITVNNSAGTKVAALASGTYGKVCLMWQRALGTWVVTDYQTWTTLTP